MFAKLSKKSALKRILVVSLTNIGDVVLTCPVIDILCNDFPEAQIDVVIGPKAASLLEGNPNLRINVFDKQATLAEKVAWFLDLYKTNYDLVVDLRQTAIALFLGARYATPVFLKEIATSPLASRHDIKGMHKKEVHINRLRRVYDFDTLSEDKKAILTTTEDEHFFKNEVAPFLQGANFVVIAPGAADSAKRWHAKGFATVADHLSATQKIIFVGDDKDAVIINDIQRQMKSLTLSLAGKVNLRQLAFLLKQCSWALTHDSGVMHLASYFNVPLVVLWGPTDIQKYAPWSKRSVIVRRNENCQRCLDPKSEVIHNCMSFIEVNDVIKASTRLSEVDHEYNNKLS